MKITKNIKEKITELSQDIYQEMVSIRRHLHQFPELSFQEYQTSAYISHYLTEWGIEHKKGIAKTGIIGWIKGKNPDSFLVALRADMDALPIEEQTEVSFRSKNPGIMHACGHDLHTASLLGSAKILQSLKEDFEGTVMLIFQPAEETLPGGARLMIEEGIFDQRKPDLILAQHVMPSMDVGFVGFRQGQYMASCDEFHIIVKGKGGHGAMPHQVTDPVIASSHLILALQQIVSRNTEANTPTVLSIGKVIANGASNIIPGEVSIAGTFRTIDEKWRAIVHNKIAEITEFICKSMGCQSEINIIKGEPVLVNDEMITAQAKVFATEFSGSSKVLKLDPLMTSDDFAHFTQLYPCTYYRLGIRTPESTFEPQHSSKFMLNEKALLVGPALMAWLTTRFLKLKSTTANENSMEYDPQYWSYPIS